jgi:hypothetical protein
MMQPVHVQDEFAPLKVALVHDGTNAVTLSMVEQRRLIPAEELRDHPEAGPVFRDRVVEQQAEFLKLLAFHGVTLLYPETQPGAFPGHGQEAQVVRDGYGLLVAVQPLLAVDPRQAPGVGTAALGDQGDLLEDVQADG